MQMPSLPRAWFAAGLSVLLLIAAVPLGVHAAVPQAAVQQVPAGVDFSPTGLSARGEGQGAAPVGTVASEDRGASRLAQRAQHLTIALSVFAALLLAVVGLLSFILRQRRKVVEALRREIAERRAAERALQDSETKLRTLIEHFPGTVFRCLDDENWTAHFMSGRDQHIVGYPTADFLVAGGRTLGGCVHPEDIAWVSELVKHAVEEAGRWEMEYRMLGADGQVHWMAEYGAVVPPRDGGPRYLDGFVLDITHQKQAALEVERQVRAFAVLNDIASRSALTLAEQLSTALSLGAEFLGIEIAVICEIHDERCRVTAIHASSESGLVQGSEFELASSYCDLPVRAGCIQAFESVGASAARDHPSYRMLGFETYIGIRLEVGGRLYGCLGFAAAEARQTPFSAGEKYFVELLARWIGAAIERDQAAQHMRRLAHMVRHSNDAMFLVRDGIVIDCNDAALVMYERAREDIIGHSPLTLSPPMQRGGTSAELAARYLAAARAGQPQRFEWVHSRGGGGTFDAEVALSGFDENGERLVIGVARDISVRKQREREVLELNATLEGRVADRTRELEAALEHLRRTQDELLQSEKLASLGALVAGVAHELNTPIGNAVTASSTLNDVYRQFNARVATGFTRSVFNDFLACVDEAGRIIERNLSRAAELIGSFKQLAVDQTSDQRRPFDLREVVQEVGLAMKPSIRRTPFRLVDEVPAGLKLDSYPGPLGQVLINLINNALVHAFEGRDRGAITLTAAPAGEDWLRLVVSDDGCGISAANLKRVFDPFFTTRMGQGGSGLGLHITHQLVTGILGGRVRIESEEGKGTSVTIELPCGPGRSGQIVVE